MAYDGRTLLVLIGTLVLNRWVMVVFIALVVVAGYFGLLRHAQAAQLYGPYQCRLLDNDVQRAVYDGDTVKIVCNIWPSFEVSISLRLIGIDTPEIRTRCLADKAAGLRARDFTVEWFQGSNLVEVYDVHPGKYAGRMLGRLRISDDLPDLSTALLDSGHATPYKGSGRRKTLCP